jgi:glutathione S-transferase
MIIRTECLLWEKCSDDRLWPTARIRHLARKQPHASRQTIQAPIDHEAFDMKTDRTSPILYSFRRCPYAIRARLALKLAGLSVEVREVSLKHKPSEMLKFSPKGTVPVLQLADGSVLDESLDIMQWALSQTEASPGRAGRAAEQALIALNDGVFKQLLDSYKYAGTLAEPSAESCRDEAVELFVAPLNQRLGQSRYLLGDMPTLADWAIVPFIRQFAGVDADWFANAPFPALQRWLDTLTQSALFVSIMPKLAPWRPGDPPTLL